MPIKQAGYISVNSAIQKILACEQQPVHTFGSQKPAPFWTMTKVLMLMGALIILLFATMVWWRYRSTVHLNQKLLDTIKVRKRTEEAL